jgi:hypothetical protein
MNYVNWQQTVPEEIKSDPLWRIEAYRLGLFIADVGWHDTTKLMRDRRTRGFSAPLSRSLGAISGNLVRAYSHGEREDRRRFYNQAVAAVSESRDWYYKSRHILGESVTWHRMTLLVQIGNALQADPSDPKSGATRETLDMLLTNVIMP